MVNIIGLLLLCWGTNFAVASNYPPDYPLHTDRSASDFAYGIVTFSRTLGTNFSSLIVYYQGELVDEVLANGDLAGKLQVWLKLNGKEIILPMEVYRRDGKEKNFAMVKVADGPYNCSWVYDKWECVTPSLAMKAFFSAARPKNGLNVYNMANAWELEAAFTIEGSERWDNNGGFGQNYRYRFEELAP